jgi:hypothetical protein
MNYLYNMYFFLFLYYIMLLVCAEEHNKILTGRKRHGSLQLIIYVSYAFFQLKYTSLSYWIMYCMEHFTLGIGSVVDFINPQVATSDELITFTFCMQGLLFASEFRWPVLTPHWGKENFHVFSMRIQQISWVLASIYAANGFSFSMSVRLFLEKLSV